MPTELERIIGDTVTIGMSLLRRWAWAGLSEFALGQNSNNLKESPVDLQPLTTIQQNNFTPQPPHPRDPITLTACVTTHPSTTSRQHHFHRSAPLYMERRIFFRSPVRSLQVKGPVNESLLSHTAGRRVTAPTGRTS